MIITQTFRSKFGELLLGVYKGQLCLCDWKHRAMRSRIDQRIKSHFQADYVEGIHPLIRRTMEELDEYMAGKRTHFDIPLQPVGTCFQLRVWKELQAIPYGQTISYLGLATRLNAVPAIRAVAAANGANALSILIPCHRVVASDGSMTGYAGGVQVKKALLMLEDTSPTLF